MECFSWSESLIAFRGRELKENAWKCTQPSFFKNLLVLAEAEATILSLS